MPAKTFAGTATATVALTFVVPSPVAVAAFSNLTAAGADATGTAQAAQHARIRARFRIDPLQYRRRTASSAEGIRRKTAGAPLPQGALRCRSVGALRAGDGGERHRGGVRAGVGVT